MSLGVVIEIRNDLAFGFLRATGTCIGYALIVFYIITEVVVWMIFLILLQQCNCIIGTVIINNDHLIFVLIERLVKNTFNSADNKPCPVIGADGRRDFVWIFHCCKI